MPRRVFRTRSRCAVGFLTMGLALAGCLSGCAAMTRDVAQYYHQMAVNFKEAEEKAKLDIEARKREANLYLKGGEVGKFQYSMRKVGRLKDWQEHCASQAERFDEAARSLDSGSASGKGSTSVPAEAAANASTASAPAAATAAGTPAAGRF